jgi:uncharacterized protein
MTGNLERVVVWKNLLLNGTDYCALWHTPEGWLLKGTVLRVLEDRIPVLATYEVHCDGSWHTHRVVVQRTIGGDVKSLSLAVESHGVWRSLREELRDVRGCEDVDLALTPATNTLPIRRLRLLVGGTESVVAAWSNFLTLLFNLYNNAIRGSPTTPTATRAAQDSRLRSWWMIWVW